MAPESDSPTSLLWAYQWKRENAYLLKRMQDLEARSDKHDDNAYILKRMQDVEARSDKHDENVAKIASIVHKNLDVDALAQKVKTMSEAGTKKRMDDLEQDLNTAEDENRSKFADLETKMDDTHSKHEVLLERIQNVEDGLKQYVKSLEQMGKRLDGTRFEHIRDQLVRLKDEVQNQGEQMKHLPESIKALETTNAEIKKTVEKNEVAMAKMAAKSKAADVQKKAPAQSATPVERAEADVMLGAQPEQAITKKKTHKYSGGGADRDIIRAGSALHCDPHTSQYPPIAKPQEPSKKNPPPSSVPKKKPQPPGLRRSGGVPEEESAAPGKSHRWAGGGADKDVIQAGAAHSSDLKRKRATESTPDSSRKVSKLSGSASNDLNKKKESSQTSLLKRPSPVASKSNLIERKKSEDEIIVDSGKGWVEVVEPQEQADNPASKPPGKRPRGRPRNQQITPVWTQEQIQSEGRATRATVYKPQGYAETKAKMRNSYDPSEIYARRTSHQEPMTETQDSTVSERQAIENSGQHIEVPASPYPERHPSPDLPERPAYPTYDDISQVTEYRPPPRRRIEQAESMSDFERMTEA